MRISFFGAAGEVTGSTYLLETPRARVLIDMGLFQGGPSAEVKNRKTPPIEARRLDAVIATHAHLDHTGRMPLLPRLGYTGPIFATPATCDLAPLIMADSAELQEMDAARQARRRQRVGRDRPVTPLYSRAEADRAATMFRGVPEGKPFEVAPGIDAEFFDAGHILGSASVLVTVREPGVTPRRVVFSGDIGVKGTPLLRDPVVPPEADAVILESTYGDRDHKPLDKTRQEFESIIARAAWDKAKVLMPAFSIGRTQTLVYHLGELMRAGKVPSIPVYVDSPMGVKATELYLKHAGTFDAEAEALMRSGSSPLDIPELSLVRSSQESRALNDRWDAAVIIAGSGMCTGGRILHHLRHNLWRRNVQVVIAGFQAEGSLGRRLVEGAQQVRIFGEPVAVRAKVSTLGGFSAHAGRTDLLAWADRFLRCNAKIILTHGEDGPRQSLADELQRRKPQRVALPVMGETIDLK